MLGHSASAVDTGLDKNAPPGHVGGLVGHIGPADVAQGIVAHHVDGAQLRDVVVEAECAPVIFDGVLGVHKGCLCGFTAGDY